MGLKDIKNVVSSLSSDEFSRFQVWFEKVDASRERSKTASKAKSTGKKIVGRIRRGENELKAGTPQTVSSLAELQD